MAWKSTSGRENAGVVDFHRLGDESSQIVVVLDAEPEGVMEKAAAMTGVAQSQLKGDLERFKEMVEDPGFETGASHGHVEAEKS